MHAQICSIWFPFLPVVSGLVPTPGSFTTQGWLNSWQTLCTSFHITHKMRYVRQLYELPDILVYSVHFFSLADGSFWELEFTFRQWHLLFEGEQQMHALHSQSQGIHTLRPTELFEHLMQILQQQLFLFLFALPWILATTICSMGWPPHSA